jgi:hypothetical protein
MNLKCEVCGRFISYLDLEKGLARHTLITPSSHLTSEEWETTCKIHTESKLHAHQYSE